MLRFALLLLALLWLPAVAGQDISGTITPAIAQPGQMVTLTVTAVQPVSLPDPCIPDDVRVEGPQGNLLLNPVFCIQVILSLAPGQSQTGTWTVPATALPGFYWMRVRYFGASGAVDEFFCFEVRSNPAQGLTLAPLAPPRVGQTLVLNLSDPTLPGFGYTVAASLTSQAGIPLGPRLVCLDPDILFAASWPTPAPGLFGNFQGQLDGTGAATAFMVLPNLPQIADLPIKLQSVVFTTALPILSNPLCLTILP